jgi:hypothetical protein
MRNLKTLLYLAIGIGLLVALFRGFGETAGENPSAATGPARTLKAKPVDIAFYLCEQWTETNSRIAVGDFVWAGEVKDVKLQPHHHLMEYDYRSKGEGILMQARCEYLDDGSLIRMRSSLK